MFSKSVLAVKLVQQLRNCSTAKIKTLGKGDYMYKLYPPPCRDYRTVYRSNLKFSTCVFIAGAVALPTTLFLIINRILFFNFTYPKDIEME